MKPVSETATSANHIPHAPLRPPSKVMRLARMGAFHPTRVSFVRTLVRRMARERWRIERERFHLDADGYGDIVYRVVTPAGTLRLVAFSNHLDPSERTDRVIATQWDASFVLTAAEVDDTLLADYRKNIPLQEAGRCHPFDLVLSRANRSVRLFEHAVECLADGRQPAFARLAEVGYLMRTTAVYGNGKFGVGDFEAVLSGGVFSLPFQAEMLTVYLARLLSFDLVEHIARARAPDRAVRLEPRVARCLGVGNATGLGMAPFLVTHPRLLDRWIRARELGLARVRAVERAEPGRVARFAELVSRARRHVAQWRTDDARQSARIEVLATELAWLSRWSRDVGLAHVRNPWDAVMRAAESRGCVELEEITLSLLLELFPELVDGLENDTGADERLATAPAMRVCELAAIAERDYDWALGFDFDDPREQHRFWYYSEEKEEPRLGERFSEPGAEREYPLHVARDVRELHQVLGALGPAWRERSVAQFLLERPRYRRTVRRVQSLAGVEYAEIRDNVIGEDCLPIDMLRCKLAIFGASKFDPKSDRWTRITLFQGAPLPDELDREDMDDWAFPVIPVEADHDVAGSRPLSSMSMV
ncbi:MAG: hypothetical protein OXU81_22690 [Gammaproteobacteria bacterium]|nr:hypothetical protein [Gammaproteobacteria bacterium]